MRFKGKSFPGERSRGLYFVHFYSPTNHADKKATRSVLSLAKKLNEEGAVRVGAVDCQADKELCSRMKAARQPAFAAIAGAKFAQFKDSAPSSTVSIGYCYLCAPCLSVPHKGDEYIQHCVIVLNSPRQQQRGG